MDIRTLPKTAFTENSSSWLLNNYYMYDDFTTPRAALAINGTAAEPTANVRFVRDTGSKLTLSGGLFSMATGQTAGDGIWIPCVSTARTLGTTLLATITPANTTQNFEVGFDSDTTVATTDNLSFQASGSLNARAGGGSMPCGTYAGATSYQIAIVLRPTGSFYFIKGGAFTNWTLLMPASSGNATHGYAAIASRTTTSILTADKLRVSKRLYVPVPLVSDGFSTTTTDGLGNPENNGPVGKVWTGATWSVTGGSTKNTPVPGANLTVNSGFGTDTDWTKGTGWTIGSGVASHAAGAVSDLSQSILTAYKWYQYDFNLSAVSAGNVSAVFGTYMSSSAFGATGLKVATGRTDASTVAGIRANSTATVASIDDFTVKEIPTSELFRSLTSSSSDVVAEVAVTIPSINQQAGLVINLDSASNPQNFIVAYISWGENAARVEKCVNGVYTNVINATITYAAGAKLILVKSGTEIRLFYNNAVVGVLSTVSDASIVNNTLHGLFSTYSSATLDSFVVWARGTNNEYAGLNAL